MPEVYLGLGSNLMPEANLRLAVRELSDSFSLKTVSPVYRSEAVGFDGDEFLNAVAFIETEVQPLELCEELERIHLLAGRQRGSDSFVSRTLDIDLLLYGDEIINQPPVRVPREDILRYGFVLCPLADIAAEFVHPVTGRTVADHWASFVPDGHALARDRLVLQLPAD
jgi:2-amino-4-hydroxy-6-hydroxymethyldihydropteridine diphosphokinase